MTTMIIQCAIVVFVACSRALAVDIVDWSLLGLVQGRVAGQSDAVYFQDVQNPFHDSHTAAFNASWSTGVYDFSWTGDEGSFSTTLSQHNEGLDGRTLASGYVIFRPSVETLFTLNADFHYAFLPAEVTHITLFTSLDWDQPEPIFSESRGGGTVALGPASGTLSIARQVVLSTGHNYILNYSADMFHFDPPPPGVFGTGLGEIRFTLSPVPEPMSAFLFAPLLWALRRSRHQTPKKQKKPT